MADTDRDEHGPVAGRTCVVCGEPAWYDLSSLRKKTGPELFVCPMHVASPDSVELSLLWRELSGIWREIVEQLPLWRIAYRCLEWLNAAYGRIWSTRE